LEVDPFEALADPIRRRLLVALGRAPHTAGELARTETVSRPAVSRHLRMLREAGLVDVTATGRMRVYRLRQEGLQPVGDLLRALEEPAAPIPADRFDALDLEVRRTVRETRGREHEETA
jgi:DNA-binding transcriptional ArsR family regulator